MGKYIKEFSNHTEYEEFVDLVDFDLQTPNISFCNRLNEVHYSPYEKHDYSLDYLTIEIIKSGTLIWTLTGAASSGKSIQYSIDNGLTWTTIYSNSYSTINVTSGLKILLKSTSDYYWTEYTANYGSGHYETKYSYAHFEGTATFNVYGNIKSILNYQATIRLEEALCRFFYNSNVINAENLILPYTTLNNGCYKSMFNNCKLLKKAPKLPATTLALDCYNAMFSGCTSLKKITCLATDISAENCTSNWVSNVSSTGIFTKAASMNNWTTGTSGIPENWTVVDAS